jgi:hypothetical protein
MSCRWRNGIVITAATTAATPAAITQSGALRGLRAPAGAATETSVRTKPPMLTVGHASLPIFDRAEDER